MVPTLVDGRIEAEPVEALRAMNLLLREDYARDSQRGVDRFNKVIREAGIRE